MRLILPLWLGAGVISAQVSGTWSGRFDTGDPPATVHLVLKQQGTSVTGTAGPGPDRQLPIEKGTAGSDGQLRFEVTEGRATMRFELRVAGSDLTGTVLRVANGATQESTLRASRLPAAALPDSLTTTIMALDAGLFDAYNACDLEKFRSYLSPSIEFYHDQGGVMDNVEAVVEAGRKNVCGKVRRELVSIEVFPIPGYGAMEVGTHRFFNRAEGKETGGPKTPRFLHIRQQKGEEWKLTRVVSFDH